MKDQEEEEEEDTFYGIPLSRLSPYPFTLHMGYDMTYGMGVCLLLVNEQGCQWRISRSPTEEPHEWLLWHRNRSRKRDKLYKGYHLQVQLYQALVGDQPTATNLRLEHLIRYACHHEYEEQKQRQWRSKWVGKYAS